MENKSAQARCVLGAAERRFVIRGGVEMKNRLKFARSRQTRQSKAMQCSPGLFLGGGRGDWPLGRGGVRGPTGCARTHARTIQSRVSLIPGGGELSSQQLVCPRGCGRVAVCPCAECCASCVGSGH